MNLNLFNFDKDKSISNNFSKSIHTFILQLENELKNPKFDSILKNDLYAIDRFEGSSPVYAVCENLRTGKMFDIRKSEIPKDATENSIVKVVNNEYVRDYDAENRNLSDLREIQKDLVQVSNLKWNPILSQDVYQIERFEGNKTEYAICQNLRTSEKFNILKSELPAEADVNSTVRIIDGKYVLDKNIV